MLRSVITCGDPTVQRFRVAGLRFSLRRGLWSACPPHRQHVWKRPEFEGHNTRLGTPNSVRVIVPWGKRRHRSLRKTFDEWRLPAERFKPSTAICSRRAELSTSKCKWEHHGHHGRVRRRTPPKRQGMVPFIADRVQDFRPRELVHIADAYAIRLHKDVWHTHSLIQAS